MDVCAGGVGYFLFGWAFAYGDPQSCDSDGVCTNTGNPFIGSRQFGLKDLPETSYQTWYFQFVVSLQHHFLQYTQFAPHVLTILPTLT